MHRLLSRIPERIEAPPTQSMHIKRRKWEILSGYHTRAPD